MDFVTAFKEAREAGMSTDDFMTIWQTMKKDEMDEKEWKRRREEREWMEVSRERTGIPSEQDTDNVRRGIRAHTPLIRRQGYIIDEDDTASGANLISEAAIGENMARYESDHPATQTLKAPEDEETIKPAKPPQALPRMRMMQLQPPDYKDAHRFENVDRKEDKDETVVKSPLGTDSDSECTSDEENDHHPSSAKLRHLNEQQQTDCKNLYVNHENMDARVTPEPEEDILCLSKEDQMKLLDTVKHLQEEQDLLKAKLTEHNDHLSALLAKQPSIRQTLRKKVNSVASVVYDRNLMPDFDMEPLAEEQDPCENDHMYVQIEQLYANYCKLHMPANAVRWIFKTKQASSLSMRRSKDDLDVHQDQFARRENSEGYWDIASVQENLALQKENEELKQKIQELEKRLSQPPEVKGKSPNKPLKTISSLPRFCQVGQNNLQNFVNGQPQTVNLRRSPSEPTMGSEYSVVAGCPVQIHPAMGTVNPVEMSFDWSICNYSRKFEMERSGRDIKTVSKPFHISHCGYLAQLEVYLNGNSSGHGRCMSVFLRIMKGSYDQHLHWPVRLSFVVVMVNQVEGKQQSLKGGSDGFSEFEFRKPAGCSEDCSDCWGFVEFVSHSIIVQNKYILNDSLLLEIKLKIM